MGSLACNGTSSVATIAGAPVVTGPPLTMAGWVRPVSFATTGMACYLGTAAAVGGDDCHRVSINSDGTARAAARGTGGVAGAATSTGTLTTGTWAHVAGVFSSASARRVLVNGGSAGSNATAVTPATATRLALGAELVGGTGDGSNLNGLLEGWAVWNVALTDAEVLALARGVSPTEIRPASLRYFWNNMGRLPGTTVPDLMGRGALTAVNTTFSAEAPVRRGLRPGARDPWRAAATGGGVRVSFIF